MKKELGEKVTKVLGYTTCLIALACFFILTYIGLFTNILVKIGDIMICLSSAVIFFLSAKIKGKQDSQKGEKN